MITDEFRDRMRQKAIESGVNPQVADDMLFACAQVYKPGLPTQLNRAFFLTAMQGVVTKHEMAGTYYMAEGKRAA